jgi:hypothetical protein
MLQLKKAHNCTKQKRQPKQLISDNLREAGKNQLQIPCK